VKDRAFTGRDVEDALRVAATTLGLPTQGLRYFVLDPGRPGSLGVAPSPARIAVLMQPTPPPPRREEARSEGPHARGERGPGAADLMTRGLRAGAAGGAGLR
jgi:hypothetical protein